MEEIIVGDVVTLKGQSYGKANFMVVEETGKLNPIIPVFRLIYISEKTGSPETIYRTPACCFTKKPLSKIKYIKDVERTPDSIIEGDIVSLKSDPQLKMVVKELSMSGAEITAIFYNPIKHEITSVGPIPKSCFNIYEMIIDKK